MSPSSNTSDSTHLLISRGISKAAFFMPVKSVNKALFPSNEMRTKQSLPDKLELMLRSRQVFEPRKSRLTTL